LGDPFAKARRHRTKQFEFLSPWDDICTFGRMTV
jgi:hypothetical protein